MTPVSRGTVLGSLSLYQPRLKFRQKSGAHLRRLQALTLGGRDHVKDLSDYFWSSSRMPTHLCHPTVSYNLPVLLYDYRSSSGRSPKYPPAFHPMKRPPNPHDDTPGFQLIPIRTPDSSWKLANRCQLLSLLS